MARELCPTPDIIDKGTAPRLYNSQVFTWHYDHRLERLQLPLSLHQSFESVTGESLSTI